MANKDLRLAQIIESILDAAEESSGDKKRYDQVTTGEMLAYCEALQIIQEQLDEDERKAYGLDFDIDKKYL